MKRLKFCLLSLVALCCSFALLSCSSEEEGKANVDYSAPAQVTDLKAEPIAGGVVLSWKKYSRWKGAGGTLPQWFIIDLGKDYPIAQIELFARQDGNGWKGQKGHQIFVCSDKDAIDKSAPTSWNWKDCGEHSFDPANNKGQIIDLSTYQVTARYIKVYIAEKFRGNGAYAFLSEMNVFTIK